MKVCKVINVSAEWQSSTLVDKMEEKLLDLNTEGWEIISVSVARNSTGFPFAYVTVQTDRSDKEAFIEKKAFRVIMLKSSKHDGLAKLVDDEIEKIIDNNWEVISVSFDKNVWDKQIAYITISRPFYDDYV